MVNTKVCSKCKQEKAFSEFYKHKGGKFGLRAQCISCRNVVSVKWTKENKESVAKHRAKSESKPEVKSYRTNYRKTNSSHFNSKTAEYRASKIKATPSWLTEDHKKSIEDTYCLAKDCSLVSGNEYDVDHIIPLNGGNVCGLHVPWNLQVLPSDVNRKKSNKHETYC